MICINCGKESGENFCESCGQRTVVKRISLKEGWNDFWSRVYGFDGMFPRTIRDLTLRPGLVAKKYIEGNRVLYYGPVGYFFLMITLYLLSMSLLHVDIKDFLSANQKVFAPSAMGEGQRKMIQSVVDFVSNNLKIMAFVIMPFNGIAAHYVFFRKNGLNYLEQLVIPFYVAGHMYWIGCLAVILFRFTHSLIFSTVGLVALPLYFGVAYSTFVTNQPKWKAFVKGVGVQIVGQIILIIFVAIILILLIALNADIYELVRPSNNH